jgi:hypothetical protein
VRECGVRLGHVSGAHDRYLELVRDIEREVPGFRVLRKDASVLQHAIHWALVAITAGKMRTYLTGYQTTIGRTVYVTPDWDQQCATHRYVTLRHERVHLRQFHRFGVPLMAVLYLLMPLPIGLAWCRMHLEREAYAETIRAHAEVFGLAAAADPVFRDRIICQFTGPAYAWMWPFRRALERWYDRALAEVAKVRR